MEVVPRTTEDPAELSAFPAGRLGSLESAAPPPIVMSAPEELDCVVFSCVKLPSATPPAAPVVHSVIGPPAVPISLGAKAFVPAFPVIRPTDLINTPGAPALMFASKAVVPAAEVSTPPAAVIAP